MSFLDFRKLVRSFIYALRGIWRAFLREQNFRIGIFLSLISIFLMIYYRIAVWEKVVLILMIVGGLMLELFNCVIEKMVDILKPRTHPYAGVIKDMMAGTVLLGFISWVIVNIIIFRSYI